jgi:GDP-4-dehydro-6-deoxy-D-mannose reductase
VPGPVLITGASGFVGPWLLTELAAAGAGPLVALGKAPANTATPLPSVTWRPGDVRDAAALDAMVAAVRPAQVYHLAAQSSVAGSLADPVGTFDVNATGTLRLLDALRRHAPRARVLLVSTAEVYGRRGGLLAEDAPLAPANPYAASKAAAEQVAHGFAASYGLEIVIARPFNHTGPGQSERFAPGAFAKQLAQIEVGRQPGVMRVGDLSARRDFLDVRDVVRAYVALMARGKTGLAYNVASGTAIPMQAILDGLLAHAKVGVDVAPDPALMRPAEIPELCGDATRLRAATDWAPAWPLASSLADLLDSWRARQPYVGDASSGLA